MPQPLRSALPLALVAALAAPALAVTGATGATGALAAPPPAASEASATLVDGCGRVDSLTIDGPAGSRYTIDVLPDGKALPAPKPTKDNPTPAVPGRYADVPAGTWTRPVDASTGYVLVRVVTEDGRYVPLTGPGGVRGTETFRLTNDDCVTPAEVTFDDQPGRDNDTYTIPSVTGVTYSPGKPGTQRGSGTVVVTATPAKGYRLADEDGEPLPPEKTRWSTTFDPSMTVEVPEDKAPTFQAGSGKDGNAVLLANVPGVAWFVDGKPAKGGKEAVTAVKIGSARSVTVTAASAEPALYTIEGVTSWTVSASSGPEYGHNKTIPVVAAPGPLAGITPTSSVVRWAPPVGAQGPFTYDVSTRIISVDRRGRRVATGWRAWLAKSDRTQAVVSGNPGTAVEVVVRMYGPDGTRSAWSAPTSVVVPLDVRRNAGRAGRAWAYAADKRAIGGSTLVTRARGASWSAPTTPTNRIDVWFGTHPLGGNADVYVDGRKRATVSTRSYTGRATPRQRLVALPVSWGRHTVTIVNRPVGGRSVLHLDGIAYGR